jgi:4-amino-4-deoxy-L-arabinose transferase-like glycosyltransferase
MAARWWLSAVFLVSLAGLGYQIHKVVLASGFVDAVGRVRAQDEAVYAHRTIRMAREGDWLTPKFLGRYALCKPPVLYWPSGLSAKLLGVSALSLRLPSLLAGTLVCVLVFAWLRKYFRYSELLSKGELATR